MNPVFPTSASSTYEATQARQSTWSQPDKIHWSEQWAFRRSAYRQLHHQKGLMGVLEVRLLEARDLKRSYWSALALPGVKHLGLSKAHGAISSFAQVSVKDSSDTTNTQNSPVVSQNDHPVWSSCVMSLPLRKGTLRDGQPVCLSVSMAEEASAADQIRVLPGVLPSHDDRILGTGVLDVSPLLLGNQDDGMMQAVVDVWIPISKDKNSSAAAATMPPTTKTLDDDNNTSSLSSSSSATAAAAEQDDSSTCKTTGRVRVLVSYRPHGLEPQPNDLVALEAFARRNPATASCRPLLSPLAPMKVLQVHDAYLLVEYHLSMQHNQLATMRIPRNAVFVLERTNLLDGAVNLALQPTDFFFSTPVGHKTLEVAGPIVGAAGEVVMPAVLSSKLVWTALRTTAFAGLTGVRAATQAVWQQSKDAHDQRHQQQSFQQQRSGSSGEASSSAMAARFV